MTYRDPETGKFSRGNPGGPGRPPKKTEAAYAEAMRRAISVDEFEKLTKKMAEAVKKNGDVAAFKVLASYLAGLPVQRLQLSTSDADKLLVVLRSFEVRGVSAGELFDGMIAELVAQDQETEDTDE